MNRPASYIAALLMMCNLVVSAQSDFKKDIADIKYKYLELAEFPNYLKKFAFVTELDSEDNKKYITGELVGYYNKGILSIIKEHTKHPLGKRTREFYLFEDKLIFVYEQIERLQNDTSANGEIKKKPVIIFKCSYYLKEERIIQRAPTGEVSPYPADYNNGKIKEQFLALIEQYRKTLSEVKEPVKK